MTDDRRWITLLLAGLVFGLCACAPGKPLFTPDAETETALQTAERLGITIIRLQLTSSGYMLDFRYQVDDPEKSRPLFDKKTIPYIIHEESGATFMVPAPAKTGPLRTMPRQPELGRQYFVFFANPGQYIKPGDHVTIVHGKDRFTHLEVQ